MKIWRWGRSVFFLVVTNILVMSTLMLLVNFLGLSPYLKRNAGLDLVDLALFSLIWGMGGALISLFLSRWMVVRMMGVRVLDPNDMSLRSQEKKLIQSVRDQARRMGFSPETASSIQVGLFSSPSPNAFATGPSPSRSIVALSGSLLELCDEQEVEAIIGHEMAHIANGDMVLMVLLQGLINAFAIFLSRVCAFAVASISRSRSERQPVHVPWFLIFVFEWVFLFLGMFVVTWFSRQREFRADRGSAELHGSAPMIRALLALQRVKETNPSKQREMVQMLQIRSSSRGRFLRWMATHPSIEERVTRLEELNLRTPMVETS